MEKTLSVKQSIYQNKKVYGQNFIERDVSFGMEKSWLTV